jgi:hypothetical protein
MVFLWLIPRPNPALSVVLIAAMAPDLGASLPIDGDLARSLLQSFGDYRFSASVCGSVGGA